MGRTEGEVMTTDTTKGADTNVAATPSEPTKDLSQLTPEQREIATLKHELSTRDKAITKLSQQVKGVESLTDQVDYLARSFALLQQGQGQPANQDNPTTANVLDLFTGESTRDNNQSGRQSDTPMSNQQKLDQEYTLKTKARGTFDVVTKWLEDNGHDPNDTPDKFPKEVQDYIAAYNEGKYTEAISISAKLHEQVNEASLTKKVTNQVLDNLKKSPAFLQPSSGYPVSGQNVDGLSAFDKLRVGSQIVKTKD